MQKEFFGGSNISNANGDNIVQLGESRSMDFPADLFARVAKKNRDLAANPELAVTDGPDEIRAYMLKRLTASL